jgi:hypothetical protein
MLISRELARRNGRILIETRYVGITGHVVRVNYRVDGPKPRFFATREEAETALWIDEIVTVSHVTHPEHAPSMPLGSE